MSLRMGKLLIGALACSVAAVGSGDNQAKTQAPADSSQAADAGTVEVARPHRVRVGGISVGASYTRFSGPYLCGYADCDPFFFTPFGPSPLYYYDFYSPFYYPGFGSDFRRGPAKGQVKLDTPDKKAEVLLNGAYVGTAEHLKSMWLEPGAYKLEVRAGHRALFSRQIYVLSGKTLKITTGEGGKP